MLCRLINISLRIFHYLFFDGVKIGILGLNGSGKSTFLKIMAGLDTEIVGEAAPRKVVKIGYLPQELKLDPTKDVRGNVEEVLAHFYKICLLDLIKSVSNSVSLCLMING